MTYGLVLKLRLSLVDEGPDGPSVWNVSRLYPKFAATEVTYCQMDSADSSCNFDSDYTTHCLKSLGGFPVRHNGSSHSAVDADSCSSSRSSFDFDSNEGSDCSSDCSVNCCQDVRIGNRL